MALCFSFYKKQIRISLGLNPKHLKDVSLTVSRVFAQHFSSFPKFGIEATMGLTANTNNVVPGSSVEVSLFYNVGNFAAQIGLASEIQFLNKFTATVGPKGGISFSF